MTQIVNWVLCRLHFRVLHAVIDEVTTRDAHRNCSGASLLLVLVTPALPSLTLFHLNMQEPELPHLLLVSPSQSDPTAAHMGMESSLDCTSMSHKADFHLVAGVKVILLLTVRHSIDRQSHSLAACLTRVRVALGAYVEQHL